MSADGYSSDAATRHQVYVQRFGNGQTARAVTFIRRAIRRAREVVNGGLSQYATARYHRQIVTLQRDLALIYGELAEQQWVDLGEFAQYEFAFNTRFLGRLVKVSVKLAEPSAELIAANVLADPLELMVGKGRQSININGALAQFGSKKSADIVSEIHLGAALGETNQQIITRLSALGMSHAEQAGSLVRTLTGHVAASARKKVMDANSDILKGKKRVATLDSRTTPLCQSLDGTVVSLTAPSPPFHWNCRTAEVPVLKDEYRREIPGSTRPAVGADGVEQVSSNTTYGEWLKKQPAAFQREVLGDMRYKLFAKGELTLDRFVDGETGKQYTLAQLRELEPHAFELAGL